MESQLGENLFPILIELEMLVLENPGVKPNYPPEALRAAIQILMSVLMDKIYDLQKSEGIDLETSMAMAERCGNDFRNLVKVYTEIDTHKFYK